MLFSELYIFYVKVTERKENRPNKSKLPFLKEAFYPTNYEKRLVSRINPSLLLKINLDHT
jgi:hypothetical protein